MNVWVLGLVLLLAAAAAVWTILMIVRDESPPSDPYFALLGVLALALLGQLVGGLIALGMTDREIEGVTFVSYLFTALLVLPVGAALALIERTRWGTGVLLVALLAVAACEARLWTMWTAGG
ncbi:MAG TPA: hypothetical protein VMF51_23930 [Nocardioides sp.]|uniref:hypothetical protein n=1 Tax=Nocardioides sp. TaxID=35761 RepID=UPI002D1802B3|nr:hypothetical protein [Nocardioides sp.]HTW18197.1 hypothetical protein [Nocardioides sp.]